MKQRLFCLAIAVIFLFLFFGGAFANASFALPTENALVNLIAEIKDDTVVATAQCLYDTVQVGAQTSSSEIKFSLYDESGNLVEETGYAEDFCTTAPTQFNVVPAGPLVDGKVYSIKATLSEPCSICERETFFSVPEAPKGSIPDNNGITVAFVLALVLATLVIRKKRK